LGSVDFSAALNDESEDLAGEVTLQGSNGVEFGMPFRDPTSNMLIPEEAAPQFRDDCAPRNGMMPPPNSEMISPPITE
jgi:hypothetical protein